MKELDEKGFVFLDDNKKPFWVSMRYNKPMLAYWNDGWVNLREVSQSEIFKFNQTAVLEEHAEIYHKKHDDKFL